MDAMLTWAITLAFLAIFAALFGFVAAGPVVLIAFAVFFALYVWSLVREAHGVKEDEPSGRKNT